MQCQGTCHNFISAYFVGQLTISRFQKSLKVLRCLFGGGNRFPSKHQLRSTTMARSAKERKDAKFKLKQPDRSGPDPSQQTLLDLAEQRGLLNARPGEKVDDGELGDEEPLIGRLGDSIMWSLSLTMLHFTLDVLVSHQYAMEIDWHAVIKRAAQAFPSTLLVPSFFPRLLLICLQSSSSSSTPSIHTHRPQVYSQLYQHEYSPSSTNSSSSQAP